MTAHTRSSKLHKIKNPEVCVLASGEMFSLIQSNINYINK